MALVADATFADDAPAPATDGVAADAVVPAGVVAVVAAAPMPPVAVVAVLPFVAVDVLPVVLDVLPLADEGCAFAAEAGTLT